MDTTEVREWAKAQGIEVKDRGRVPLNWWPGSRPRPGSRVWNVFFRRTKALHAHADVSRVSDNLICHLSCSTCVAYSLDSFT